MSNFKFILDKMHLNTTPLLTSTTHTRVTTEKEKEPEMTCGHSGTCASYFENFRIVGCVACFRAVQIVKSRQFSVEPKKRILQNLQSTKSHPYCFHISLECLLNYHHHHERIYSVTVWVRT